MKRIISLALCLSLALGLAACGGKSGVSANSTAAEAPQAARAEMSFDTAAEAADAGGAMALGGERTLPAGRKIILNADLTIEATDFPAVCEALRQAAGAVGGYISSSEQSTPGTDGSTRWARYTFRVPADKYAQFLQAAGQAGNVTYQTESTEDITANYVDVEARIHSLEAQRDQLLTLLENSGELETLLAIQEQLSDVQYRLESYEAQRRIYDDQVADSTVTVDVQEVRYLTQQTETFGQRLSAAFTDGWRSFGAAMQELAVLLAAALPFLLILALAGIVCLALVRRSRRKKAAPPTAQPKEEAPPRET